jgi:hypothetical protein
MIRNSNHKVLLFAGILIAAIICFIWVAPPTVSADNGKEEPVSVKWEPALKAGAKYWNINYQNQGFASNLNFCPEVKPNSPADTWDSLILGGEPAIRDYTLSFQLLPSSSDYEAGIIFRAQNIDSLYCLFINTKKAKTSLELQRWLHGKVKKLKSVAYSDNISQKSVQISLRGENIKVMVEGKIVMEASDDSFAWGRAGMICKSKAQVSFKNLVLAVDKGSIPPPKVGIVSAPVIFQVLNKPEDKAKAAPAPTPQSATAPALAPAPPPTPQPTPAAPLPSPAPAPTPTVLPTPLAAPTPHQRFAEQVVDYNIQGINNQHMDPNDCIGAPNAFGADAYFVSLGGGWIVLDMGGVFRHGPGGVDLKVYEVSTNLGDSGGELYEVLVSMYREGPWTSLGTATGVGIFDLSRAGVQEARFVKIVDKTTGDDGSVAPGVDLDAVETLY